MKYGNELKDCHLRQQTKFSAFEPSLIRRAVTMPKAKQYLYRPRQVLSGLLELLDNEGDKISPRHRPILRPWRYLWYSFLLEAESTP